MLKYCQIKLTLRYNIRKEFFINDSVYFSDPSINFPVPREEFSHMATQCLTYLSFEDFNWLPVHEPQRDLEKVPSHYQSLKLYPFLKFSQHHWSEFVLHAKFDAKIDSLWMAFDRISTNASKLNLAFYNFIYGREFRDSKFGVYFINYENDILSVNLNALVVAVYYGMDEIVYRLIDNGYGLNTGTNLTFFRLRQVEATK